jgi:hypothetical protein
MPVYRFLQTDPAHFREPECSRNGRAQGEVALFFTGIEGGLLRFRGLPEHQLYTSIDAST